MVVKEYKIVCYSDAESTTDEVNNLLGQGWVMHGGLKVVSGRETTYSQAMVKEEYPEYGGIDSNILVTIDELDGIKYAIDSIGDAIETLAKAVGYAAPTTPIESPKSPPKTKPAKSKRKPSTRK